MTERRYAVLVASSQFEDQNLQKLQCPENDVDGLEKILKSKEYGNFSDTFPLKNVPHYKVLLEIERAIQMAGRNDLILIYYSGHGKQDRTGKLHLATINTNVEYLRSTSISINSIKDFLEGSRTKKVILILDCCYSGLAGEAFARGGVNEELQSLSSTTGTYIITASSGTQVAFEKPEDGYGVFTKHTIEGIISWEAANREGNVTIESLYSYVHRRMQDEGVQTPMKWALNVKGDLIIASRNKTKFDLSQNTTDWDSLTKSIKSDNIEIRKSSVKILRNIGSPAVKSLIQALKDENTDIRKEIAEALGFIGDAKAIEPLIQALKDNDKSVREESRTSLSKIGIPAIEPLVRALKDKDSQVRKQIVLALGETRNISAVDPLISVFKDSDSEVLIEAVSALEKIGKPAVEPLIQALKDKDGQVRKQAALALGKIGDTSAVEPLIQVLNDNDSDVRGRTASALGKIGDIRAVEPLIRVLNDSDSDVRGNAAFALGKIGVAKAVEPLIWALKDDNSTAVREEAAMALGSLKDQRAIEPLIRAAKDDYEQVREAAVVAVGKLNLN